MDIVSEAGKGNSHKSVPNDFVPLSSQPPHQDTSEDGGGSNNARMYDHYHQQQQKQQQQQQHRPLQQQQEQQQQQNRPLQQQQEQQQQQQKAKRKHRRGKPKPKNANKPYKKINWKFQIPRPNYNCKGGHGGANSGGSSTASRAKLLRSRSLVPYNTNKFLMEEHLAEVPSSLLTPSGRTRDSSFSIDSDENYFHCLPEDEEEFLTKEFDNIYENSRVERLENMTKQQLIEECLQIEDRYSSDQGTQHLQQLQVQRISSEFAAKIRVLEEKIRELTRENFDLRSQLMRSAALAAAAAASPPSAAAPTASACQPTPMDSTSEDSESDSSTSSSSAASFRDENNAIESDDDLVGSPNYCGAIDVVNENLNDVDCASTSSGSPREYIIEAAVDSVPQPQGEQQLLGACMEEDDQFNTSNDAIVRSSSNYVDAVGATADEHTHSDSAKSDSLTAASTELQTPL